MEDLKFCTKRICTIQTRIVIYQELDFGSTLVLSEDLYYLELKSKDS